MHSSIRLLSDVPVKSAYTEVTTAIVCWLQPPSTEAPRHIVSLRQVLGGVL
jgi:hypothetical protein